MSFLDNRRALSRHLAAFLPVNRDALAVSLKSVSGCADVYWSYRTYVEDHEADATLDGKDIELRARWLGLMAPPDLVARITRWASAAPGLPRGALLEGLEEGVALRRQPSRFVAESRLLPPVNRHETTLPHTAGEGRAFD